MSAYGTHIPVPILEGWSLPPGTLHTQVPALARELQTRLMARYPGTTFLGDPDIGSGTVVVAWSDGPSYGDIDQILGIDDRHTGGRYAQISAEDHVLFIESQRRITWATFDRWMSRPDAPTSPKQAESWFVRTVHEVAADPVDPVQAALWSVIDEASAWYGPQAYDTWTREAPRIHGLRDALV